MRAFANLSIKRKLTLIAMLTSGVALLAAFSVALMDGVVGSHNQGWHAYRWIMRFITIAVFILEYVDLYREGRRVKAEERAKAVENSQARDPAAV